MTPTLPSLLAQRPPDVSRDVWACALRWATLHSIHPLSLDQHVSVARAYVRHDPWSDRRVGICAVNQPGHAGWLAWVNEKVYVIDSGQLWAFRLTPSQRDRFLKARSVSQALWRHYQAHRLRPDLHALRCSWDLRPDRDRRIPDWVRQKIETVFAQAGISDCLKSERQVVDENHRFDPAHAIELSVSFVTEFDQQHQAINEVFRVLRKALPRPVRATLWGNLHKAIFRGSLAHWLWHDGGANMKYRSQALEQQPILLTMALQATGQWPVSFSTPAARHRDMLQPHLDRGKALSAAIDQGRPWLAQVVDILRRGGKEAWLLHGGGNWQPYTLSREGLKITEPLARHMGRSTSTHFPDLSSMGYWVFAIEAWMHAWAGLSRPRRPTTPDGIRRWVEVLAFLNETLICEGARVRMGLRVTENVPAWFAAHVDGFMKGLPEDIMDPHYSDLLSRSRSLVDTIRWMNVPSLDRAFPTIGELMSRLTWRQWDNFVDRAHEHARQIRPASASQSMAGDPLSWAGARVDPVWSAGNVCIHELTDEMALTEEGDCMDHCVGGSGMDCAGGHLREFSVRRLDGTRLSTLELAWEKGGPVVIQHLAAKNDLPAVEATEAVAQFVATSTGWRAGPWDPTPEHQRREAAGQASLDQHDVYRVQLSEWLWNELDRCYPPRPH